MTKETQQYVVEKTKELMGAFSCCQEAKDAAQAWLDCLGTAKEKEQTEKYIVELEADLVTVDALITVAESEAGKGIFGEKAPEVAAHGRAIKAAGAKYCDCPACAAVEAILAKKEEMLG